MHDRFVFLVILFNIVITTDRALPLLGYECKAGGYPVVEQPEAHWQVTLLGPMITEETLFDPETREGDESLGQNTTTWSTRQ